MMKSPPIRSPDQKKARVEPEEEEPPTPSPMTTASDPPSSGDKSMAGTRRSLSQDFDEAANVIQTPVVEKGRAVVDLMVAWKVYGLKIQCPIL